MVENMLAEKTLLTVKNRFLSLMDARKTGVNKNEDSPTNMWSISIVLYIINLEYTLIMLKSSLIIP